MKKQVVLLLIILLALAACEKETPETAERGYIISTKEIRDYTPEDIQALLDFNDFQVPFTLEHKVSAVKIAYMTPDPAGKLVNATGGIYIPETTGDFPIICFQHGTQTHKVLVPSLGAGNSDAGMAGAVAASMGFICVAADYLGLGESEITPPYLMAENSATTVIDMLRASLSYLSSQGINTNGNLYLAGYSQGGHITMATHHEIEKNYSDEFQVTASAPMAGPYDLKSTIDTILQWEMYERPILMAYLMNSYNHYNAWVRLPEIFKEPYATDIPGYFDGLHFMDGINNLLPQTLSDLLQESFISGYMGEGEQALKQTIQDNSLLNFTPTAPVLLIHGDADMTVPIENSKAAEKYYKSKGKTNVELHIVEGDHVGAAPAAIVGAMQWFDTLENP